MTSTRSFMKNAAIVGAAAVLLVLLPSSTFARTKPVQGDIDQIRQHVRAKGQLRVIVGVDVPSFTPEGYLSKKDVALQRAAIYQAQRRALAGHPRAKLVQGHQYVTIPAMAVDLDAATLDELLDDDNISSVEEDVMGVPALRDTTSIIGIPQLWSGGFDGTGYTVAIIDSGVAKSHRFFANGSGGGRVAGGGGVLSKNWG